MAISAAKQNEIMGTEQLNYLFGLFQKVLDYFWPKLVVSVLALPAFLFQEGLEQARAALLVLIVIDFLSGVLVAKKTSIEIKSAKIFRTALKTVVYFAMVAAGNLTEQAGITFLPINETIIAFLAATELISVIENAGRAGYAIPRKLLNQLERFRDDQEKPNQPK